MTQRPLLSLTAANVRSGIFRVCAGRPVLVPLARADNLHFFVYAMLATGHMHRRICRDGPPL